MINRMSIHLGAFFQTILVAALVLGTVAGASAETTLERILREKTVVIGIHNRAPWGFRDQNGQPAGYHPDLVKAALAPLGVEKIELVIADFGALIPGLTAKRFDMIASGVYITPKRCEVVTFGNPDLKLTDAALVKAGNPKNIHSYADIAANKEVIFGVTRGSTLAKNAAAAGVPEDRTLLFQNTESSIAALQSGRVDAIVFTTATAISVLSDAGISGIERATPFTGLVLKNGKEKSGYPAITFRKDDADLRDRYNERLAEMKADGTIAKIMNKYGFSDSERVPEGLTYKTLCSG